ncbi:MAG TPA: PQQ-binding-like beta-propeller repeat protein [Mycobacteriales bacterium]|nr:PQQ-binding-like beta-propeller repeat protein [Mycobacteriales bacterium]
MIDPIRRRIRPAPAARLLAAVVTVASVSAACSGGVNDGAPPAGVTSSPVTALPSGPRPSAASALGPDDWPTYHRDNSRHGVAPHLAARSALSMSWSAKLDGAVYGQPLVVGTRLLAATENDTIYALDPDTGQTLWSAHVGTPVPRAALPCGNIDPLGITGTMVYDPDTGLVFAVAEITGGHHILVGVDVSTGKLASRVTVDPPKGDPVAHQQRGALTLLRGRVYVPYGGLAGDCARYVGSVVSAPTTGAGGLRSYAIPTSREGGIWATPGGVVDGDRLLFAAGNGASHTNYDGSDSVISLTRDLTRADFFAPSTWPLDNESDLDLGSMSPVLVGRFVYIAGKRGVGYLLRPDRLGGIGGQVSLKQSCRAFGGSAVDGDTMYLPCPDGPMALRVGTDGTVTTVWKSAVAAAGSPVVGGGVVWVVDYDGGVLYALNPTTGGVLDKVTIGTAPHFASPTLSGGSAYVGTVRGVVAVNGA